MSNPDPNGVSAADDEAIQKLKDLIQLLPRTEKIAFVEATERNPQLIETESPPHQFLAREEGGEESNKWAAAARLAAYWENRCKYNDFKI